MKSEWELFDCVERATQSSFTLRVWQVRRERGQGASADKVVIDLLASKNASRRAASRLASGLHQASAAQASARKSS